MDATAAAALSALSSAATARAAALGLPTQDLEDWRYVACTALDAPLDTPRPATVAELRAHVSADQRAFVVVDGRFHSLGHGDWPAAWKPTFPDDRHLAAWTTELANESDVAAAWSLAGDCRQVIRIIASHDEPLHLVNVATGGTSGWTVRLELAAGVSAQVVVRHLALGAARSCPRIEATLGAGAHLTVSEVQATPWAQLLTTARLSLAADAQATWVAAGTGGNLVRHRWEASLTGKGAEATYRAAAVLRGSDQAHHLTRVVHAAGHTSSVQDLRAVLHDRARRSFDGLVTMPPGVDGSNAEQRDRSLVLSPGARADTRPQLDIRADAVKAAHGATIGRLDKDELLYLRMRGLDTALAQELLTGAFTGAVVDQMADVSTRRLATRLLQGTIP